MKILATFSIITILFLSASGLLYGQVARDFARMANAKLELGDYRGAREDFSSVIRLQPEFRTLYRAYFGRGYANFQLGDYEEAKSDFDRAIRIYPNDPEVFFWRGYTRFKLRQSAASEISDYSRAILLNPDYAEAYFNRGQARIKNNQVRTGCADLRRALELNLEKARIHVRIHCGEE